MANRAVCAGIAGAAILGLALAWAPTTSAVPIVGRENTDAAIYVIHGIPGEDLGLDPALEVDVLLNDTTCLLWGFRFPTVAGPVSAPPGDYNIKISLTDPDEPCGNSGDAVIHVDVNFGAGESATVVAHLAADGSPSASKFENDLSWTYLPRPRVTVHHTAAVGAVDITLRRERPDSPGLVFLGAENGETDSGSVFWGVWKLFIGPPGVQDVVFHGPVDVEANAFNVNLVYVVGSLENGTLQLITNRIYRQRSRVVDPPQVDRGIRRYRRSRD